MGIVVILVMVKVYLELMFVLKCLVLFLVVIVEE